MLLEEPNREGVGKEKLDHVIRRIISRRESRLGERTYHATD